ncbi:FAD-binding protein, partial [bacterium]|nr:FAD-binding protein [bacterium]
VHYSMGGLWVDYEADADGLLDRTSPKNHMTNIPGLYAVGEVDYQYHGANRLGANSLLSCIFGGMVTGPAMIEYTKNLDVAASEVSSTIFDNAVKQWESYFDSIRKMQGKENPFKLHQELGEEMIRTCTIVRENEELKKTLSFLDEIDARWNQCNVLDTGKPRNQSMQAIHQIKNMIELAKVIAKGALLRDECRGSHLKNDFKINQPKDTHSPEYQEFMETWKENNKKWLKTTIATYSETGPEISYEDVDTRSIEPVPRRYD